MPEIEPLRALHYDLRRTGGLQDVVAPPYDVIDAGQRTALAALSPYNAVAIDLPDPDAGGDRYAHAAALLAGWRSEGVLTRDDVPALWPLEQDYVGPDGAARTRRGFLARVRVEPYGAGRIRPHERTHPGPRRDRLELTRATRTNLSPIFSLFSDPAGAAWAALASTTARTPWAQTTDPDGTVNRLWRVSDPDAIQQVRQAASGAELLIADGHHRYETARVYAEEIGGEGPHRYALMCLVALQDSGLTVFPTHRLVRGLTPQRREALAAAMQRDFDSTPLPSPSQLVPAHSGQVRIGYIDSGSGPRMLSLKSPEIAAAALPGRSAAYRGLDTAVLEALVLKGALGMTDEQIDHLDGLGYARDDAQVLELIASSEWDAAFLMAPMPIASVQAVTAAGEVLPPKSTYFFPKVPTGLIFNPLSG
ncbi:MAG: DUF1015 domain-containing protein [Solirubrobacteraceae bacterium]